MMDDQRYLDERLDDQLKWYEKRAGQNKYRFMLLSVGHVAISATIVLLVSIYDGSGSAARWSIGALGVIATVIAGALSIVKYQENWIQYRTTSESLKHELFMYRTATGAYAISNPFPLLVERVEGLISKEHSSWVGTQAQPGSQSGAQGPGGQDD